ncbi:MAG TPA: hypothetical protein QGG37_05115 [Chloroflexota bacterium]|nr:hypothetical protein [Chloroflexota bacterium]
MPFISGIGPLELLIFVFPVSLSIGFALIFVKGHTRRPPDASGRSTTAKPRYQPPSDWPSP